MKTKRLISGAVLTAWMFGAAWMLGADPVASTAEAGRKHRYETQHRDQRGYKTRVVRHHRPTRVVQHRPAYRHHTHRPWYYGARRVYVNSSPFYWNIGLGVYLGGGVSLGFQFGNVAPAGYVYADPYCDLTFQSVGAYRRHLDHYGHSPALRVVAAPVCAY